MTKADIVEQIYEQVGFSKKESAELVEKVFDAIKTTLADGEKVKISGFGNFVVRGKNSRKGRNPTDRPRNSSRGAQSSHLQAQSRAKESLERRRDPDGREAASDGSGRLG